MLHRKILGFILLIFAICNANMTNQCVNKNNEYDIELKTYFAKYDIGCVNCYIQNITYYIFKINDEINQFNKLSILILNSCNLNPDMIDYYIKSNTHEINYINGDGFTPLMIASMNSNKISLRLIKSLLINGADPNIEIITYINAYEISHSLSVQKLLIEFGYINRTDNYVYFNNKFRHTFEVFTGVYIICNLLCNIYMLAMIVDKNLPRPSLLFIIFSITTPVYYFMINLFIVVNINGKYLPTTYKIMLAIIIKDLIKDLTIYLTKFLN